MSKEENPSEGGLDRITGGAEDGTRASSALSSSQDRSLVPKDDNRFSSANIKDLPSGEEGSCEDSTARDLGSVKRFKDDPARSESAGTPGSSEEPRTVQQTASACDDGSKSFEKASTEETGACEDDPNDKTSIPDQPLEPRNLFSPSKISELAKTNIFTKAGSERVKRESTFLQTSLLQTRKDTSVEIKDGLFTQPARISYLEDDEWIHFGDGEVRIVKNRFVFIRNSFKMVLMNFGYGDTAFVEEDGFVLFEARSKKSTGDGFEVVNRRYRIEFDRSGCIDEFLDLVGSN